MPEQDLHHTHTYTHTRTRTHAHVEQRVLSHTDTHAEREPKPKATRSHSRRPYVAESSHHRLPLLPRLRLLLPLLLLPTDGVSVCYADGKARPHTRAATHTHTHTTMSECERASIAKWQRVRARERSLSKDDLLTEVQRNFQCHDTTPHPPSPLLPACLCCLCCLVMPVCSLGCASCCAD